METARRIAGARAGARYGFTAPVTVDFGAVMTRVRRVIADVEQDESPELLSKEGIDLVQGWARFTSPHSIDVDGQRLTASRFVLATGAHAAVPPIPGLKETTYLDNKSIFALTDLPAHLLVLGGGAIGCELAQAFRRLGSQVTVVEGAPTLLIKEEPEAAAVLTAALTGERVTVRTGAAVERVSNGADGPQLHLSDGTTVTGTHLLVAVGRTPATAGMSLEVAGVERGPRQAIGVDPYLRTSAPHVFAIGDCATPLQFTHVADEQGRSRRTTPSTAVHAPVSWEVNAPSTPASSRGRPSPTPRSAGSDSANSRPTPDTARLQGCRWCRWQRPTGGVRLVRQPASSNSSQPRDRS